MKIKRALITVMIVALTLAMSVAFVACGNNEKQVTALALNMATVEVDTGGTARLAVTATYEDSTTDEINVGDVTWESDNTAVATVMRGIIAGKSKGTAKITATYGGCSAVCNVTVNAIDVVISGYTLNDGGKVELEVDDELTLSAKVTKNDVELEDEIIVWSTSNPGIALVSNGVVTGVNPGEATITATRQGTSQSSSITVVVAEIEGAEIMKPYEQNKTPTDNWGYWGDKGYNWSITTIYSAYTEENYEEKSPADGFQHIGAGKVNITFSVDKYAGDMAPGAHDAAIQLFYRSSKDNKDKAGKLEANHNYEIKLTIRSNTAGTVLVNPFDDIDGRYAMDEAKKEDHTFELVANVEQEVTVQFRHGDSGAIYGQNKYTNVESAVNILLGKLSAPQGDEGTGNVVKVSVYNIQFKDLGESTYKWVDDPTELEGYVDPDAPEIPETPTLILPAEDVTVTGVTLTEEDGKAYLNLAGTINLEKFDDVAAAQQWLNDSYFDLQQCGGSWDKVQFNRTATVEADGSFVVKYDITRLTPDTKGTGAYSAHFTEKELNEGGEQAYKDNKYRDVKLDAEAAVHGASVTVGNKKYSIVNYKDFPSSEENNWGQEYNWGVVSIKVETVEAEDAE